MKKELIFIGRKAELQQLNSLLQKKSASLVIIKGRRRVGKSRMIEEFAQNTRFYEFAGLAPESFNTKPLPKNAQRKEFVRQMAAQGIPGVDYNDWGNIFWHLSQHTQSGRIIILFDEISWMGQQDPDFLAKLKNAWDIYFKKNPELILILCSSISVWIDKNILSSSGFFGRISWEITLEELSLAECNTFLENLDFNGSVYEKFKILSITGGIPWYLEQIQSGLSADENIKRLCFTKNGLLVNEFEKIFHDLFDHRGKWYKEIVRLLANKSVEFNEICTQIDYKKSGRLSEYLDDLITAGFIRRDFTWNLKSGKTSNLSKYRLSDNYLRFYLKYIEPNYTKIKKDQFAATSMIVFPGWNSILGLQFENLVLNNCSVIHQVLGIRPEEIVLDNPFFQRRTNKQLGCQIDYLIQTKYNTLFACEIKFSRNLITTKTIHETNNKLNRLVIPRGFSCFPVLIHVNGVSEEVEENGFFAKIIDFSQFLKE